MKISAAKEYGKSSLIEANWNLDLPNSARIAAIITYSGTLEYYIERAVWRLKGVIPKGVRPETDGKAISKLISDLEECSGDLSNQAEIDFIKLWCSAARSGFIIRNNIAHGVAGKIGDTLVYMRNPRWHGEERKRDFGDFWAEEHTLDMVCDSLSVLLRIIIKIEAGEEKLSHIASSLALKALREARSILGEFSSQGYNPSFEKY
ncbi:MAG: hypothetical protein CMH30_04565 [Micavibrio sp.]|nr:hypothetical protein [Micavibrio sp.]|tara:strand:- start:20 stop:634 length:615 start_codon:yes stop_codon:yes gene_type:complete